MSQKYFPCPCVQTCSLLVSKCKALQMSEVSEPEFVRACSLDGELGNTAVSIYRGFIGCWSFMYERWESGAFFTQTKPPKGKQRSLPVSLSVIILVDKRPYVKVLSIGRISREFC